jgi:dCMP deaminase
MSDEGIKESVAQELVNTDWNRRFMDLAKHISTWSKDRSTKVGAVIVNDDRRIISTGYNGLTIGLNDKLDMFSERPLKYKVAERAERNAVYSAARIGVSVFGCTMYSTCHPCADCARAIVQSGLAGLCCPKPDFKDERWGEDFVIADNILNAAKIKVKYVSSSDLVLKICANSRTCPHADCRWMVPAATLPATMWTTVTKEECALIESMGTDRIRLIEVEGT